MNEARVELPMHCIDLVLSEALIILFHTLHSSPCCKSRSFPESKAEILCIISDSSLVYFKAKYGSSSESLVLLLALENIEVLQKVPRKVGVPRNRCLIPFWIKCHHNPNLVGR
jgi:hypothetical protein